MIAFCNPLEIKKCVELRIVIGDLSDSLPPHSGNLPRRKMKFLSLEAGFLPIPGNFSTARENFAVISHY
jgi:hypothetical protein